MSGKESKRSKARRKLCAASPTPSWPQTMAFGGADPTPLQSFGNGVTMNVNEVATEFNFDMTPNTDAERITELMDAPVDLDIAAHEISRGPNPYLDRCMHCSALRPDNEEGDEGLELLDLQLDGNTVISSSDNPQPFSSFKLEIWTCANCRKAAKNFQSFLIDLPFVSDKEIENSVSSLKTKEENDIYERDELRDNWVELQSLVKDLYWSKEDPVLTLEQEKRLKILIDRLCLIDPHQLFLGLEDKVREIVTEIKIDLVTKLKDNGCDKPELALDFTSALLAYYDSFTIKAHILAQYLGGLSSHLKRFEVTWELLNKHLFHSIAHNDPAISNSGPTILEQLRQGSVQYERSKDDPYCSVRKRLLKFQEEMSVVVVVWRDCQQLIESYCHEEVKNTHKQLSSKTRSFINQQRQLLKEHLLREPYSGEALSETMKNLMAGHKSSMERVMCHRCKRERCTCDECTITHRITCGIINSDLNDEHPPNTFNFALDNTRNVIHITPPSMSSTTSSSGSVSPINIEDKLTNFYGHSEEFSDALMNCEDREGKALSMNGDGTSDNGEEDEADDEDECDDDEYGDVQDAGSDEPHSLQDPAFLWEAMQEHQREQLRQQHVYLERLNHHSCSHRANGKNEQCPFQPPIDLKLSRKLDAELAKSGLLSKMDGDFGTGDLVNSSENDVNKDEGGGPSNTNGGLVNSSVCANCQCHACLKQNGHVVSTSLPTQVAASPSPADLHLYPHIHGLPQQDPKSYMFDLPHLMSSIKLPVRIDFDDQTALQDHFYHSYSDWDSTMLPRPGSLAAQHQHQQNQRLSGHTSDLLPPPPLDPGSTPFTFDLASHLATHTTHTSTTNTTSAFKSVNGKHFASCIMPTLSNKGNITSEGSSVDPTKPLDFASLTMIPQSCLNGPGAFPAPLFSHSPTTSCVSSSPGSLTSSPATSVTSSPTISKSNRACQGPPCSRPTPLGGNAAISKWEKGQHPHCKKFSGGGHHLKQQLAPGAFEQIHLTPQPLSGVGGGGPALQQQQQAFSGAGLKNLFPGTHQPKEDLGSRACPLPPTPAPRPGGLADSMPCTPHALPPPSAGLMNNISVGTSAPCNDPECEVHNGDNCDSIDDSCSEKSSGTANSNQKEGKYCDCCYCEFFGHNNATTAKTSANYIETKDRLRKILKKRNESKHNKPNCGKNGVREELCTNNTHDPLEKKGLEGLLRFINGTEDDCKGKEKEISAKAAKRARQKQKKMEEQAKIVAESKETRDDAVRLLLQNKPMEQIDFTGQISRTSGSQALNLFPVSPTKLDEKLKQEINNGKPLIIESTRSTLSLSRKEADKRSNPQNKSLSNNLKGVPQNNVCHGASQMLCKKKAACDTITHSNSPLAVEQENKVHSKSNKESMKVNSPCCQQQPKSVQQPTTHDKLSPLTESQASSKPAQPVIQKKQQNQQKLQQQHKQSTKSVNGKNPSGPPQLSAKNSASSKEVANSSLPINGKATSSNVASSGPLVNGHSELVGQGGAGNQPKVSTNPPPSGKGVSVMDSPGTGSGSSASQSPSCGTKGTTEQGKQNGKSKKKKKNKNGGINYFDEIFMPKSESELDADVDDFERELEEFKRFCFEPAQPREKRKIAVNVNLKDIFKKKTGLV